MFSTTDTIAAIATPAGRGGIGVVRISGPAAQGIACALLGRAEPLRPRHATFAHLHLDGGTRPIGDQVVVTSFPAPHSYTTEDCVEISAHGSPVVLSGILDACVRRGARLAAPGEFTFRAYLHGRIELTQAEAVADLVDAVTPLQARAAYDQLEGSLATSICALSDALLDLTVRIEASLDFPDEGFHFITPAEIRERVESLRREVRDLLQRADEGRVIREGSRVVIAGPVNAGKSSLFNRLTDMDRAIVAAAPGTTRDLLVEQIDLAGVPVTLVDTAGLRSTDDEVEAEGVRRAKKATESAAVTVLVLDRSEPLTNESRQLVAALPARRGVVAANKCDLPPAWRPADLSVDQVCDTSAQTGSGLTALRAAIARALGRSSVDEDSPRVTNVRHANLLRNAEAHLLNLSDDLTPSTSSIPEEVVAERLAATRTCLERISGRRTSEDVLAQIFERFCIGK